MAKHHGDLSLPPFVDLDEPGSEADEQAELDLARSLENPLPPEALRSMLDSLGAEGLEDLLATARARALDNISNARPAPGSSEPFSDDFWRQEVTKHLQGAHDQQRHAGEGGPAPDPDADAALSADWRSRTEQRRISRSSRKTKPVEVYVNSHGASASQARVWQNDEGSWSYNLYPEQYSWLEAGTAPSLEQAKAAALIRQREFAERIRKHLQGAHDQKRHGRGGGGEAQTLAAKYGLPFRERDPEASLYLRFGPWDEREFSANYATGDWEPGVSVYDLDDQEQPVAPPAGEWAAKDMEARIAGDEDMNFGEESAIPFLVQGRLVGEGGDGEPLLKELAVVGLWSRPLQKHLQGQHDQKRHGRKQGGQPDTPSDSADSAEQRVEIGVAAAHETYPDTASVLSAHSSLPAHATLESDLTTGKETIGMPVVHRAVGIWQGALEPSFVVHMSALTPGAEFEWAAELGAKYDQDAVMLFHHSPSTAPGPDAIFRVRLRDTKHADRAATSMAGFGLDGGSYDPIAGELRIASFGGADEDAVRQLATRIGGSWLPPERGRLTFLERADYDRHIPKAAAAEAPRITPYNVTMEIGGSHIGRMAASRTATAQ